MRVQHEVFAAQVALLAVHGLRELIVVLRQDYIDREKVVGVGKHVHPTFWRGFDERRLITRT